MTEHHVIDAISPQWQRRNFTVSLFLNAVPLQILPQNSFAFSSFLLMYFSEYLLPVSPKAPGVAQGHIWYKGRGESIGLKLRPLKKDGWLICQEGERCWYRSSLGHSSLNRIQVMSHSQS